MTEFSQGRSLELFFINGKPDGMLTAEVFNWTGHVLMTPRVQLGAALQRVEASFTGVYLLLGEQDGIPTAYIGEGENIAKRIRDHDLKKDWWTSVILVTSTANNLHKAHVQYLEARLIEEAREVSRITLENGNNPARPSLSEASRANMEAFLNHLLMVLPAIRVDMFLKNVRPSREFDAVSKVKESSVLFELFLKKEKIHATAILIDGEFVVQKGSMARKRWVGDRTDKTSYWKLFDQLVAQGLIVEKGGHREFTENYAFSSTSAAGAVVNGRSTAGPLAWKLQGTNQTYKAWEVENLAKELL